MTVIFFTGEVDNILTLSNLKEVTKQVWDARTEWFKIGLALRLKSTDLKAIEKQNCGDLDSCLRLMVESWLKRVEPAATWKDLIAAVQSVGLARLANEIGKAQHKIASSLDENTGG